MENVFLYVSQNVMTIRLISMIMDNQILVWCFIIGVSDFSLLLYKSKGPYRYSEYRQTRLDETVEWLKDYNRGIFPVIGSDTETWSYSVVEKDSFISEE